MTLRRIYNWKCRDREIVLGKRTLVMGILNVTPDSFSDGGSYSGTQKAAERALEMERQGADIIDIGGESTRPGADPVSSDEEVARTVPVIEEIRRHSDVPISIDTMKTATARAALAAGADIVNDVSAFEGDAEMASAVAEFGAGAVLMHMQGSPQTMQQNPAYDNVIAEIGTYLKNRVQHADAHGIAAEQLVLDPGIGFGKTVKHNIQLLRQLDSLSQYGFPLLIGASRKSFIGHILGREEPKERLAGSLAAAAFSVMKGAHILRVHDVLETCDVCRLVDTLNLGEYDAMV